MVSDILEKKLSGLQKRCPVNFEFQIKEVLEKVIISVPECSFEKTYAFSHNMRNPETLITQIAFDLKNVYPRILLDNQLVFVDKMDYRKNQVILRKDDNSVTAGKYFMRSPISVLIKRIKKAENPIEAGKIFSSDIKQKMAFKDA